MASSGSGGHDAEMEFYEEWAAEQSQLHMLQEVGLHKS